MYAKPIALFLSAVALAAMIAPEPADASARRDYRVRARLRGQGTVASGKADYRERNRGGALQQRFNVEIERAAAETTYEIRVNGNLFGTITTDTRGFAELEFGDNDGSPALPGGFPHLVAGNTASVGPISGTFQND
jgi:hypothetical protein